MIWNYSQPKFYVIPQGTFRARIASASWDISRSGKNMIVVSLRISGQKPTIKHYIVSDTSSQEAINRSNFFLKKFCDAFAIDPYSLNSDNFDLNQWVGLEGGVVIEHQSYGSNGNSFPRITRFLTRKQLDFLPKFVVFDENSHSDYGESQGESEQVREFGFSSNPGNVTECPF